MFLKKICNFLWHKGNVKGNADLEGLSVRSIVSNKPSDYWLHRGFMINKDDKGHDQQG